MSWRRLPQEAKACKFCQIFNIYEGLVLLKLADTVLILINPSPSNVKVSTFGVVSSYFQGQNKFKIHTKFFVNIKMKMKYTFLIQNRLQLRFLDLSVKRRVQLYKPTVYKTGTQTKVGKSLQNKFIIHGLHNDRREDQN